MIMRSSINTSMSRSTGSVLSATSFSISAPQRRR
jgi:hypothetical protein